MTTEQAPTLQERLAAANALKDNVDSQSTTQAPSTNTSYVTTLGQPIPYPEKEGLDIPHNTPAIDPAANGNGISDPVAEKPNADAPVVSLEESQEPEPSVEDARERGFKVFKKLELNYLILKDGSKVPPTRAGYFFAVNKEMDEQLTHYATNHHGLVEEVK